MVGWEKHGMDLIAHINPGVVALSTTAAATPLFSRVAPRLGLTDVPDWRKRHSGEVPLCGIVIAVGVLAGLAYAGAADGTIRGYFLAALVIVSMGLLDDRRGLSCFLRLLGQIFAACIVASCGIPLLALPVDGLPHLWGVEFMLTVVFLVAAVNAVNFLDGLDGLAGGCAFFSLVAIVIVAYHHADAAALIFAWVLAAAVLGFLFYNIYPARVFMGDTGSTFVGFSLGIVTLMAMGAGDRRADLLPALMIVGVPMLDMGAVILERLRARILIA